MKRASSPRSRAVLGGLAATVVLASATLSAPPAGASAGARHDHGHHHGPAHAAQGDRPVSDRLAAAWIGAATARYRDVDRAVADGYVPTDTCSALPGVGGMGYHYVNPTLARDMVVDPARPEVMVYYRDQRGRLQLGAAEWFVADPDQDLATDAGRPSVFGRPFDGPMAGHEPGMPVHFDLHAWVGLDNPTGLFAPWNPRVTCG
jgi:hypothetical protein